MLRMIPAALLLGLLAQAQSTNTPYPSMAPLDQYLIADANAEIALARSDAPKSISDNAEVMVLERQGYKTAVKGTNGFVCMVERSWTAGFGDPAFWNPKIRGPICFNPPAVRTYLPITIARTRLPWRGKRKPRCSTPSTPLSTRRNCPPSKPVPCATCCRSKATWTIRPGTGIRI